MTETHTINMTNEEYLTYQKHKRWCEGFEQFNRAYGWLDIIVTRLTPIVDKEDIDNERLTLSIIQSIVGVAREAREKLYDIPKTEVKLRNEND